MKLYQYCLGTTKLLECKVRHCVAEEVLRAPPLSEGRQVEEPREDAQTHAENEDVQDDANAVRRITDGDGDGDGDGEGDGDDYVAMVSHSVCLPRSRILQSLMKLIWNNLAKVKYKRVSLISAIPCGSYPNVCVS